MAEYSSKREIFRVHRSQLQFDNIRTAFDQEELYQLGMSVKKRQWIPLVVKPDGNGNWTVVDGQRRVLGGDLVGIEEYDAIGVDEAMTVTQLRIAQATTAIHRAGLTGWEQYRVAYELIQTNPDWTGKTLADELGLTASMAVRLLSPSKCIREVRDKLEAGRIGISICYEISKERDETKQAALLEMKLNGASRDELERHRRKPKRRGNRSSTKESSVTIPLPSGMTVIFRGVDVGIDELIEAAGDVRRAAMKGREDDQLDAKGFEIVMRQKAKGKCRSEVANA